MKLYISGPISSRPDTYQTEFGAAESYLSSWKGHVVLNPAVIPKGLDYEEYFLIDFVMIDRADAIVMLRGWKDSPGAKRELAYAVLTGKKVFYGIESVPIAEVKT